MREVRSLPALVALCCAVSLAGCTNNNCTGSICGNDNDRSRVGGTQSPKTPVSKSATQKIKELNVGLDVDFFERTLGRENRVSTYAGDTGDFSIYEGEGGAVRQLTARIYKVEDFYVQTGANKAGTVVVMVIQSCNPKVKVTLPRQGDPVTLNETRFVEMSPALPKRARYNVPVSNPGEYLEFSSPLGVDHGVAEVWGAGPACNSGWAGNGDEPIINWIEPPIGAVGPSVEEYNPGKPKSDPWKEVDRFRKGKVLNLYGKASPVYRAEDFPLLPGHGTPEQIVTRLERPTAHSGSPGALT
ncbi:hypothetical protein [Streptomyces sp. NPDC048442]|uniref:hypothetical protein n=1 Tax=Streptomyces sp. NPDC048442 TaxID=3154823 RepID=UPI003429707D